ncbi:LysR family transcriptional regulator [Miltoncostaea oceani]|uniref:LysR family transcriptional regulator n=1 Tax=Miltoncostaea oceani TaxID=2843216 RepID=UPI001C3CF3A7|nr:LysR family transcriptional regulator [Miltoncostaea oceani]
MERDGWLQVEVRHLAALRAVAEAGSFGGAATLLGYTQSAVSQQIATLERATGVRLIDRPGGPRRISMTEAGRVLLRHAERITADMEAAWADLAALADGATGTLRVGTYQSVGARILPDLMRRFLQERPGVTVELTESGNDAELLALLERGELDLSFTVLPMPDGPYEGVELMTDPYVLMVAASDPLAGRDGPLALTDLAGRPLIGFRHCLSGEFVDAHIRRHGVDLDIVFRSDDNGTVQGLVGAGMASALVPLLAADPGDDRVAVLPMGDTVPSRRIAVAWHRDRALSAAAEAFIASAARVCDELQPAVAAPSGTVQGPPDPLVPSPR